MIAAAQNARVVLRWKEVPGAAAYEVQIARDAAFVEVVLQTRTTTPGYRWEQLPTTTYWWRARSFDGEGRASEWSAPLTISGDSSVPLPKKPVDGAVLTCGGSSVFELETSGLAKEFELQLSSTPDFAAAKVVKQKTAKFAVTGLTIGTWHWRARAVDINGRPGEFSVVRSVQVRAAPPKLKAVPGAEPGSDVTLSWSTSACAKKYLVEYRSEGKPTVAPVSSTRFTLKQMKAGTWRWRVAGVDEEGVPGPWSARSEFQISETEPVAVAIAPPPSPALPPWLTVAARAGLLVNGGAVLTFSPQLAFTARLPLLQRQLGVKVRAGYYFASQRNITAHAVPVSFHVAWHQPFGDFLLRGGLGPVVQLTSLGAANAHNFVAAPGVEVAVAGSYRLGPGRLELELSFLYARVVAPTATLNTGGFGVRLGYAFDFFEAG